MSNNDYARKINNIMDKAKEDVRTQIDRVYQKGYADAKSELGQNAIDLAHKESNRAYQQGLEDAWEAAGKIAKDDGLPIHEVGQIFGTVSFCRILKENTASEAIAKIKEYEEQQKQDAEIQVGDEIIDKTIGRAIVLSVRPCFEQMSVLTSDGSVFENLNICIGDKTGRTFPQIAEVLAEIRGE